MPPLHLILWTAAGAGLCMSALWIVQYIRTDATIVDIGWSYCLLAAALFFAIAGSGLPFRRFLFVLCAGIWAARLGTYLLSSRLLRAHGEDSRYLRMRTAMGRWAQPGFFLFFQLQTLFVVIFAIPFICPVTNPATLSVFDSLALLVWGIAFAGETIADWQLNRFRRDPANKGSTCQTGLWRYSRHPNYFFEWLHWFTYIFFAIGSPWWWLSLSGPVIMFLFLFFVTGIPHTEREALSHRDDYAEYKKHTSMFIPWFRR